MAAGIGGPTIAEAKRKITLYELHTWRQYRAKGLLVTAHTHEHAAALIALKLAGGKLADYLPKRDGPSAPPEAATIPQAMAALGGVVVQRGD